MSNVVNMMQNLPTELYEMIAERLEPADLVSFHCTDRKSYADTDKVFAKACFTELKILLLSERSIMKAFGILNTSRFKHLVRRMTVYIDEAQPGNPSRQAQAKRTFGESNLGMQRLIKVFDELRKQDKQIKLTVATRAQQVVRRKSKELPNWIVEPDVKDITGLMKVLGALYHSGYRPREFMMNSGTPSDELWYMPVHKLVKKLSLPEWCDLLGNVEALTLDLWTKNGKTDEVRAFFKSVAALGRLEHLTIFARDWTDKALAPRHAIKASTEILPEALLDTDFTRLKTLRLWGCAVSAYDLLGFLIDHKKKSTLKRFEMGQLSAYGGSDEIMESVEMGRLSCEKLAQVTGLEVALYCDDC